MIIKFRYSLYIPGIYQVYRPTEYTWYIHGIYRLYTSSGFQMVTVGGSDCRHPPAGRAAAAGCHCSGTVTVTVTVTAKPEPQAGSAASHGGHPPGP